MAELDMSWTTEQQTVTPYEHVEDRDFEHFEI